jgi:hypothetical protein
MTNIIYDVTNFAALRALTGTNLSGKKHVAYKSSATDYLGGVFQWDGSDLSAEVAEDSEELNYVVPTAKLADGSQGAFVRLGPMRPLEQWNLKDFPGADWDAKLAYALANLDDGAKLVIPSIDDWMVFEDNHVIDVSYATGRDIYIDNHAQLQFWGTGYFLTIKNADNVNTTQQMHRAVVKDLFLVPDPASHWGSSGGVRIQNAMHTVLINPRIIRFGLAGVNLHNKRTAESTVWTEQCRLYGGYIAGNRIGLLGDQDTYVLGAAKSHCRSQRGTQIRATWFSAQWGGSGADWPTEASRGVEDERRTLIQIEDVSWYHGILQCGLGLKRNNTTGIYLKGGAAPGSFWHVEGESFKNIYSGVRGIHLETTALNQSRLSGCQGSITIMSIGEGEVEEEEGVQSTSVPILDERTGVTGAAAEFGDLRIRGSFFFETPTPDNGVLYRLLPKESVTTDADDFTVRLDGWVDTDNTVMAQEWVTHAKEGGYKNWTKQIFSPTLKIATNAYGTTVPAGLECLPYNENPLYKTALLTADGVNYLDITEDHACVVRVFLDSSSTLHQVLGGRPGQTLTIYTLDTNLIIGNNGAPSADGSFQMANAEDWYAAGVYACRTFIYVYHSTKGWFWLDRGGTPSDTGQSDRVRESYFTHTQLKALRATPRSLVAAPGSGYATILTGVQFYKASGTEYVVAGDNDIELRYTDGSGHLFATVECTGFLDQTTAQHRYVYPALTEVTPVDDAAIMAVMAGTGEITTGTGSLNFRAFYRRIKLGW